MSPSWMLAFVAPHGSFAVPFPIRNNASQSHMDTSHSGMHDTRPTTKHADVLRLALLQIIMHPHVMVDDRCMPQEPFEGIPRRACSTARPCCCLFNRRLPSVCEEQVNRVRLCTRHVNDNCRSHAHPYTHIQTYTRYIHDIFRLKSSIN